MGAKILIVDDDEGLRWALALTFEDEGYEVHAVGTGLDALECLKDQSFDVVITDLGLPDLDGMEILRRIKGSHPETIVVILTGQGSERVAVEAMRLGVDDYFPKGLTEPEEMLMRLAKAIEMRRLRLENQLFHQRLEIELDTARKIQQSLLPQLPPAIEGIDIGIFNRPAKQVGGDYHDLIEISPIKLGIAIGDVSGKGMPAALLMANVQASLRRYSESAYSPREIIYRINNSLCPICQLIEEHRFITLFYGVLDLKSRKLVYSNAGHNHPFVFQKNGDVHGLSDGAGLPCGIMENALYDEAEIELEPGDVALFYTDGITEAMSYDNAMFGEERLLEIVSKNLRSNPSDLTAGIYEELANFVGDAPQYDDLTLMVLKVKQRPDDRGV